MFFSFSGNFLYISTFFKDFAKGTEEILDFSSIMNPKEAIEIASQISEVQGLAPIGWSLDAEYGVQIYTVEFRDSYTEIEAKINANTGEILEVEVDD
ncbi:PepSY domain-containing protein [Ureibacillus thermophilus]|uniref:PepSY domain-containing protein n=1 Tax=Ureibacillus thermophilus TaxID=367743 RepID=UPI0036073D18